MLLPTNSFILLAPVAISSAKCLRSVSKPIGAPVSGYLISRQISASGTPWLLNASTQPRCSAVGLNARRFMAAASV
jgi:hypothetical protein